MATPLAEFKDAFATVTKPPTIKEVITPPEPGTEGYAQFLTAVAWPIRKEKPLLTDELEDWLRERGQRGKNDEEKARRWAEIALLYVYLEAKLLMCSKPSLVRHMVNAYRELALHISDRGWVMLQPPMKDEEAIDD